MPTGAPLVGRDDDLHRFTEVLQGVIGHRHPAVVFVTGEGGVGKSRFIQEAVAVARGRGVLTLHGTAGPLQRDLSYAPLVEALRPLLRGTGPSGRARIEALLEGLSDLARLFDGLPLAPPQPLNDLGLERTRLFEAVTRLLDRAASERPVVLVLDDLHWADPASLGLLHYAVRGLIGRPVLFLLAFREAEADTPLRDLVAALRCGVGFTEFSLRPLDSASVDALARATLGGAVPSRLVEVLTQRTGGVPLFVGAVITRLVEDGTLFRSGGRWVLGPETAEAVPTAVRSLLGGRIERLPGAARAALDALAVCGGSAPADVLAAIVDEDSMSTGLDLLCQSGLADQEFTDRGVAYRVTHPMLTEVGLELLPAGARRRRHAAAARAWQQAVPEDLGTIAFHVCGAGNEVDPEYALDVLLRAGAEALSRRAGEETAVAARAALLAAAASSRDELRGPLLERLAQGEELVGRLARARDAWRAAAEAGGRGDPGEDGVERARRLHRAALTGWDLGRFPEALRDLDEADVALVGLPPGPVHVSVLETRARLALRRGDAAAQRRHAAALAAIVEVTGSPRARVVATMIDFQLAGMERRLGDAMECMPRMLEQAEALGDPVLNSAAHRLACLSTLASDGADAAWQRAEDGLELARSIGVPTLEVMHLVDRGYAGFLAGRWDEALDDFAGALELAERTGLARGATFALTGDAMVLAQRGRLDEAAHRAAEATDRLGAGSAFEFHGLALLELAKARIAMARGQYAQAVEHARRSVGQGFTRVPALLVLASAGLAAGDQGVAQTAVADLAGIDPAAPYPSAVADWAAGRLRGDPDVLASAAAALTGLGVAYEAAVAQLDRAEVLAGRAAGPETSARTEAAAEAAAALCELDRMGAKPQADRARQLLRSLGQRTLPPPAGPRDTVGLTRREEEVVRLVATGLSNAAIAERLFISQRTVTTHLQHVYARLDLRTRAALTRYVDQELTEPGRDGVRNT
ncbi:ATP-binding protein [Geodermatophilus sp. URMC 62]|uniref:ATP-binding protein n=1 Tax=Geodermatophilus sp. URMC 62 TaxID=3423414 RepID=UPI00406C8A8C